MNAKNEFLEAITESKAKVRCAIIYQLIGWNDRITYILPENYTSEQMEEFLTKLDFDYDCGYGSQNLDGYIWYKNNTWSERRGYDGSEWWEYKIIPDYKTILNE